MGSVSSSHPKIVTDHMSQPPPCDSRLKMSTRDRSVADKRLQDVCCVAGVAGLVCPRGTAAGEQTGRDLRDFNMYVQLQDPMETAVLERRPNPASSTSFLSPRAQTGSQYRCPYLANTLACLSGAFCIRKATHLCCHLKTLYDLVSLHTTCANNASANMHFAHLLC